jgi:hypothetical protein
MRRRFDAAGFIFGALFVAAAGWWVLDRSFELNLPNLAWIIALVLIIGGVAGIASVVARGDRGRDVAERERDRADRWR